MEVSTFLAKLIGLYLLVFALLSIFRKRQIIAMSKELVASKITLAVSAEISLIFGLVIVIDHSIWEWSWRLLITLIGYLMILKAVMRFAFPEQVKKMVSKMSGNGFNFTILVMLILGAYLTYCGFTR